MTIRAAWNVDVQQQPAIMPSFPKNAHFVLLSGGLHSAVKFHHLMKKPPRPECIIIPIFLYDESLPDAPRAERAVERILESVVDEWGNSALQRDGKWRIALVTLPTQTLARNPKSSVCEPDTLQAALRLLVTSGYFPKDAVFSTGIDRDIKTKDAVFSTGIDRDIKTTQAFLRNAVPDEEDWSEAHYELLDELTICTLPTAALYEHEGPFAQTCNRTACVPCTSTLGLIVKATDGCIGEWDEEGEEGEGEGEGEGEDDEEGEDEEGANDKKKRICIIQM